MLLVGSLIYISRRSTSRSQRRRQGRSVWGFEIMTLRLFSINGWCLWLVEIAQNIKTHLSDVTENFLHRVTRCGLGAERCGRVSYGAPAVDTLVFCSRPLSDALMPLIGVDLMHEIPCGKHLVLIMSIGWQVAGRAEDSFMHCTKNAFQYIMYKLPANRIPEGDRSNCCHDNSFWMLPRH